MTIKNPPRPRPSATKNSDALGRRLSIAQAIGGSGVTRDELYRLIRGKSAITPDIAIRLEKSIGGTGDISLRGALAQDLAKVRAGKRKWLQGPARKA
jgi:plasmid maintenance system antidote protein VapI